MHISVNKDEYHDYYSIISAASLSIQNFAKHSRMGIVIMTNRANQFHEVPHFWVLPNFQISPLMLGIWRWYDSVFVFQKYYHLAGQTSRSTNYLCNMVNTRNYENVDSEHLARVVWKMCGKGGFLKDVMSDSVMKDKQNVLFQREIVQEERMT